MSLNHNGDISNAFGPSGEQSTGTRSNAFLIGVIGLILIIGGGTVWLIYSALESLLRWSTPPYDSLIRLTSPEFDTFIALAEGLILLSIAALIVRAISRARRSSIPAYDYERAAIGVVALSGVQSLILVYKYYTVMQSLPLEFMTEIPLFLYYIPLPFATLCLAIAALLTVRIGLGKYKLPLVGRVQKIALTLSVAAVVFPVLTLKDYIKVVSGSSSIAYGNLGVGLGTIFTMLVFFLYAVTFALAAIAILRASSVRTVHAYIQTSLPAADTISSAEGNVSSSPVVLPPPTQQGRIYDREPARSPHKLVGLAKAKPWVVAAGGVMVATSITRTLLNYASLEIFYFAEASLSYIVSVLDLQFIGAGLVVIALGLSLGTVKERAIA